MDEKDCPKKDVTQPVLTSVPAILELKLSIAPDDLCKIIAVIKQKNVTAGDVFEMFHQAGYEHKDLR